MNHMFDEINNDNFQFPWSSMEVLFPLNELSPNNQNTTVEPNTTLDDPFGTLFAPDFGLDFNWDPADPLDEGVSPMSSPEVVPGPVFPPSPSTSNYSHRSSTEPMSFEESLRQSMGESMGDVDIYAPLYGEVPSGTIHVNTSTPPASNHPSPSGCIKDEPKLATTPGTRNSPSPQTAAPVPPRRRGPGRPSKAELLLEGKKPSARTLMTMRRQFHNDSATRSRARFNKVLTELWNEVPEAERTNFLGNDDPGRQVCRAEKIETVISYIRKLQRTLHVHGLHFGS